MTVPERITEFLNANKGRGFCDNCIKIRLKLARPQQAQQATSALATTGAFLRADANCAGCGGMKKVTWAKWAENPA
jgi:hypothetical protein